ncbi:MAG: HYR domain-containing protein [Lewinellaceae bacterium]|nr:HYR domain-containing protein [Lewinellaceae bacterium]
MSQGRIIAGGTGTVSIQGLGGKGTSNGNMGVTLESSSLVSSGGGDVSVIGLGTGTGVSGLNYGVQVVNSILQAGSGGNVSVRGNAGNAVTGNDNFGVFVNTGGQILAFNGNLDIIGQGGGKAPASGGVGVMVRFTGRVVATGSGAITIKGTGGTGVGPSNIGVSLQNTSLISSDNGKITITGIEGTSSLSNGIKMSETALITSDANIELIANSILIGTTASIVNNANNTVTLRQWTNGVAINLGPSPDPIGGPLNLSDAELDRVTTGKLVIGNNLSGSITVTDPITRPSQTDVTLITAGSINLNASSLNTAGGLLTFQATQGVNPTVAGIDVEVGTVGFAPGTGLNIHITGTIPDVGYPQLNVVGSVNLTGSKLTLTGSFIQPQCIPVMIIKNDGADPVIGNFNGLPEGFVFVNYLGSGKNVSISYVGGDGNDVVLIERVIPIVACPANIVKPNDFGFCGRVISFLGTPLVTENCSYNFVDDAPADDVFDIGVTTVTYVITDVNGNSASCTQTVTISDTEFPTFVCPANIEVLNQENEDCGAVVDFVISASDNCPGVLLEQNYFSGDVFGMGFNYVVATATDASGNVSECNFRISVNPRPEICNGLDDDCDGYTDELQDWEIQTKLFASDPANANQYGQSVDMKGDWGIVGSNQNVAGEQRGTAYILHRDAASGTWGQATQLFPDNSSLGDVFFGEKVAIGNGFCAVSARLDDENGVDAGAVYIFKYNGPNPGDWTFYQKILGTTAGEQIGSSLDYFNELLLVGATQNADVAAEAGAAYLFAQVPIGTGNWNLVKKLAAPDSDLGDHFGYDVAVSGNHAVVTAKDDDEQGIDAGAAYVFGKDQGGADNWGLIKKLLASDGEANDNFGVSVDLDGAWAVIGAHRDDDKGPESGSAYIFYQNDGGINNWGRHTKLTDYNGAKGEQFGYDVSIDGDYIAVGARWERVFQSRAGAIFVYHKVDNGWGEFARLTDPANLYNDQLGSSVVIDNFSIMAGIPGEDLPQLIKDCGAVLVFNGVCGDQRPSQRRSEPESMEVKDLSFQCFPVPFDQTLTIQLESPTAEIVQVRVFDLMGREIALLYNELLEGSRSIQWNASSMPSGNYFIRVSTASKTVTKSVVHTR